MTAKAEAFIAGLKEKIRGKDIIVNHAGSMFTLFFNIREARSFEDVKKADLQRFARFFRYMFANKFYISPSQFEANFLSIAHTERELERFIKVAGAFGE
jgi:glutamate-1-semialdehyde 2,1-aminomutase